VNIPLETALKQFCQRFFEQVKDDVAYTISTFGMLGYSAEEPRFKGYWYEALFNWMHGFRKTQLDALDNKIDQIRAKNKQNLRNWIPDWYDFQYAYCLFALILIVRQAGSSTSCYLYWCNILVHIVLFIRHTTCERLPKSSLFGEYARTTGTWHKYHLGKDCKLVARCSSPSSL
jgi:hypothetical protein